MSWRISEFPCRFLPVTARAIIDLSYSKDTIIESWYDLQSLENSHSCSLSYLPVVYKSLLYVRITRRSPGEVRVLVLSLYSSETFGVMSGRANSPCQRV